MSTNGVLSGTPAFWTVGGQHLPQAQRSGVLMLSSSGDVLYLTPNARALLQPLYDGKDASVAALPPVVQDLYRELEATRQHCLAPQEWAYVQVQRLAPAKPNTILLRGFVVSEIGPSAVIRLLVILEALVHEAPKSPQTLLTHPSLTARQTAIARGLMRGLTNKELANELRISEHTVKEYIRVIMTKVQATTRAGVVARLAGTLSAASTGER